MSNAKTSLRVALHSLRVKEAKRYYVKFQVLSALRTSPSLVTGHDLDGTITRDFSGRTEVSDVSSIPTFTNKAFVFRLPGATHKALEKGVPSGILQCQLYGGYGAKSRELRDPSVEDSEGGSGFQLEGSGDLPIEADALRRLIRGDRVTQTISIDAIGAEAVVELMVVDTSARGGDPPGTPSGGGRGGGAAGSSKKPDKKPCRVEVLVSKAENITLPGGSGEVFVALKSQREASAKIPAKASTRTASGAAPVWNEVLALELQQDELGSERLLLAVVNHASNKLVAKAAIPTRNLVPLRHYNFKLLMDTGAPPGPTREEELPYLYCTAVLKGAVEVEAARERQQEQVHIEAVVTSLVPPSDTPNDPSLGSADVAAVWKLAGDASAVASAMPPPPVEMYTSAAAAAEAEGEMNVAVEAMSADAASDRFPAMLGSLSGFHAWSEPHAGLVNVPFADVAGSVDPALVLELHYLGLPPLPARLPGGVAATPGEAGAGEAAVGGPGEEGGQGEAGAKAEEGEEGGEEEDKGSETSKKSGSSKSGKGSEGEDAEDEKSQSDEKEDADDDDDKSEKSEGSDKSDKSGSAKSSGKSEEGESDKASEAGTAKVTLESARAEAEAGLPQDGPPVPSEDALAETEAAHAAALAAHAVLQGEADRGTLIGRVVVPLSELQAQAGEGGEPGGWNGEIVSLSDVPILHTEGEGGSVTLQVRVWSSEAYLGKLEGRGRRDPKGVARGGKEGAPPGEEDRERSLSPGPEEPDPPPITNQVGERLDTLCDDLQEKQAALERALEQADAHGAHADYLRQVHAEDAKAKGELEAEVASLRGLLHSEAAERMATAEAQGLAALAPEDLLDRALQLSQHADKMGARNQELVQRLQKFHSHMVEAKATKEKYTRLQAAHEAQAAQMGDLEALVDPLKTKLSKYKSTTQAQESVVERLQKLLEAQRGAAKQKEDAAAEHLEELSAKLAAAETQLAELQQEKEQALQGKAEEELVAEQAKTDAEGAAEDLKSIQQKLKDSEDKTKELESQNLELVLKLDKAEARAVALANEMQNVTKKTAKEIAHLKTRVAEKDAQLMGGFGSFSNFMLDEMPPPSPKVAQGTPRSGKPKLEPVRTPTSASSRAGASSRPSSGASEGSASRRTSSRPASSARSSNNSDSSSRPSSSDS